NALVVSINWDAIVLIISAKTAASTTPPISIWKTICRKSINTVSGSSSVSSGNISKKVITIKAVNHITIKQRIIQLIPILPALYASLTVVNAIKRTIICGWSKYPRPQANPEIITNIETPLNKLNVSGLIDVITFVVSAGPPVNVSATIGTNNNAKNIIPPCTASV